MADCFCGHRAIAKRLCWVHYQRNRRTGTTTLRPPRKRLPEFWSLVDRSLGVDGCWLWKGSIRGAGYGGYGRAYAHRRAWELTHGQIRPGMTIDHLCFITICCNPGHMRVVSAPENASRKLPARHLRIRRRICPHRIGGRLPEAFTYTSPKGKRQCRACAREKWIARCASARKSVTAMRNSVLQIQN